jgi:GTP-binding protein LepA
VAYRVVSTTGEEVEVRSPAELPNPSNIETIHEPYVRCTVLVPSEYVGAVMELCQDRRGSFVTMEPIENRQQIVYDLPLAEIVLDFYDQLKSRTKGYASLDYDVIGDRESPLVKLDILLAGDHVDALSMIVHRDVAYQRGKGVVERLQKTIPRQLFEVPIQAAIGSKIIARETVKARRKDVLAKCYGGDITRKRKLLERQKEGKKRMKQVGRVEVPQEAFLSVLSIGEDQSNGKR